MITPEFNADDYSMPVDEEGTAETRITPYFLECSKFVRVEQRKGET
jgi:hypothetical protein